MNSNNNNIIYCEIKQSYREHRKQNLKSVSATEYASWMLETNRLSSRYEVIQRNKKVKFYFDIEKLPDIENTQHVMIHEIRTAISRFFQERTKHSIGSYIITHNKGSETHPGASYHLIFDQVIAYPRIIFEFVKEFIENHLQYKRFIDCSVYSKNRLFKSAYNIGTNANKSNLSRNPENYHYFLEEKQITSNLLRSIITYVSDPSKCFEVKDGVFKAQHTNASFFAKISASDNEEDAVKTIDPTKTKDDNVKVSNIGDKIDYTPYENHQQQSDSVQQQPITEIENNTKTEREYSDDVFDTPDEITKRPPTTSRILFDQCYRQTSLEEAADVISPLINEIEDRIWKRIDIMCDYYKIYKEDDNVKFCKWDIGHQLFDDKHINLIKIAHALENYRNTIPLCKEFTKHYELLTQCFQLYPCGQSKELTFELFLACINPSSMSDAIDVLNTYKKSTILLMFKFIDYITQYLHTTFDNLFIKCKFIKSFLVDQTLHVLEYHKMLDICERFDIIDELQECVNSSKSLIQNQCVQNQCIYNQCIRDLQDIPKYFSKMNNIVKQIISNPKYVEKQLTLADFFEK